MKKIIFFLGFLLSFCVVQAQRISVDRIHADTIYLDVQTVGVSDTAIISINGKFYYKLISTMSVDSAEYADTAGYAATAPCVKPVDTVYGCTTDWVHVNDSLHVIGKADLDTALYIDGVRVLYQDAGDNVFCGQQAGQNTNGPAGYNQNTIIGVLGLRANLTGISNSAIGYATLNLAEHCSFNTAIGGEALYSSTGNNNIALGYNAGKYISDSLDKRLYIGSLDRATQKKDTTHSIIYGKQNADSTLQHLWLNANVHIGSNYVLPFVDGSANEMLLTDGSGTASWTDITTICWDSIMTSEIVACSPLTITATQLNALDQSILFSGTTGATPTSGAGTRLMWIPAKYAFRAGQVAGVEWDADSIGDGSAAFGLSNVALGLYSFAAGNGNVVDGNSAVAFGDGNKITSMWGVAFGNSNTMNGGGGLVVGNANIGGDEYSITVGSSNYNDGASSACFGTDNYVGDRGKSNLLAGRLDTIAANSDYCAILGGSDNKITADYSAILGGSGNKITGNYSSIIAGYTNTVTGKYSSIISGNSLTNALDSTAMAQNMYVAGDLTVIGTQTYAYGTMGFADSSVTIPMSQNGYYKITNTANTLYTAGVTNNVTFAGDSATVVPAGDYLISWDLSYSGSNTDTYHTALFVNGTEQSGTGEAIRDMTTTNIGTSSCSTILTLPANANLAVRIKNSANDNDATVYAGNLTITKL